MKSFQFREWFLNEGSSIVPWVDNDLEEMDVRIDLERDLLLKMPNWGWFHKKF